MKLSSQDHWLDLPTQLEKQDDLNIRNLDEELESEKKNLCNNVSSMDEHLKDTV
jgi:hypothetical protein